MQDATPEQIDKAFRLCDMLGLTDVTIAFSILQELNWSVQKAMEMMQNVSQADAGPAQQQAELPINYTTDDNQQEGDQQNYQYLYNQEEDNKNNRRMFDEAYEEIKLDRSTTEPPTKMEKKLSFDRHLIQDFANFRHVYQAKLLADSEKFCAKLFGQKTQKLRSVDESKQKNQNNRNFICYLSKNYRCSINFTFGTLGLNLARAYLDKKILLVYIHQMQHEDSRSLRMILSHKETTKFINTNCVSYGMFDNSDDYETVQKYVALKDLPAFALFKYSKKTKKEEFIASYQILQKSPENFMEWLATHIGVSIKKKNTQGKTQQKKQVKQEIKTDFSHRDIMSKQNEEYEQMERIYLLRRKQSKLKKQQIENAEKTILKMRENFAHQLVFQPGKTLELKFRLPQSGKSITRVFSLSSKIREMFDFISCFGRDEFEQRYAKFDLTQTFPRLSLVDLQQKSIEQVFPGSSHQNIIVKEL